MVHSVSLAQLTPLETRNLWTELKDDPHVSDFIPIDPVEKGSTEKTKAYLEKAHRFILDLPRSQSLNDRIVTSSLQSSILPYKRHPVIFSGDSKSHQRIERLATHLLKTPNIFFIAKLRKQEDFTVIITRLIGNPSPIEVDLEDACYLRGIQEELTQIETLDLSSTYIATFPSILCSYLQKVRSINLSLNNLGNTPLRFLADLFQLPLLEELDLSYNCFSKDDWSRIRSLLPLLKNLRSIRLSGSNLGNAPGSFLASLFDLPHLKQLDISSNGLSLKITAKILRKGALKEISINT